MSRLAAVPLNNLTRSADPAGPNLVAGDTYYNSTVKQLRVYDGSAWIPYGIFQRMDAGIRGAVTVGVGKHRFYIHGGGTYTIDTCAISVDTAPTGATLIVDVNVNGTTIYTTQSNRPAIAISGNVATGNTANVTTYTSGDYFTFDVDQIGSTVAGSDLMITLRLRKVT